jgi:F-type H+-transporting ATPase subunit gamma
VAAAEQAGRAGAPAKTVNAIVFGSDQGLVGQFNEVLADFVAKSLDALPGEKNVWAVGDRTPGNNEDWRKPDRNSQTPAQGSGSRLDF